MMDEVLLWSYVVTATLLVVHEIDSAFWKEWELFHLPFGHQGFVLLHLPLVGLILFGLVAIVRSSQLAAALSLLVAGGGVFAFCIHTYLMRKGHPEFTAVVSRTLLVALLISSSTLGGATIAWMAAR